jgi:hypothetical protein
VNLAAWLLAEHLALSRDDPGPDPAGLHLLPTWALEQQAAANREVIAVLRQRLAAGEAVARLYQEPGLAWLERQAQAAEQLAAQRKARKN